jgi:hypothetical protein
MKIVRLTALVIVAVLTWTVASEAASCLASDVRGHTWYTYVKWTGGWTRCTIRVTSTGAIAAATGACRLYDEDTATFTTLDLVSGGSITVNTTTCLVTGVIKTSLGTHTIVEGRVDPGKTLIVGAGRDGNADAWTFSAVRT